MSTADPGKALRDCASCGLDSQVESFVNELQAAGFAQRTIGKKRRAVRAFTHWLKQEHVSLVAADQSHVDAFLRCPQARSPDCRLVERTALARFLRHLRSEMGVAIETPCSDPSPGVTLEARYVQHLRDERGLKEHSIQVYLPFVRRFLATQASTVDSSHRGTLTGQTVREFFLEQVRGRSPQYSRLLATALRSFLRFLFLHAELDLDLSVAVPTVRRWSHAPVHAFFSPDEVERIVSSANQATPTGCRDHAILLLLARLGLRAGEVVALELDDIHWRAAEIIVRGKGRVTDRLPLLSDVGEALAFYVQENRGCSASRRVFLRAIPPRLGLTGPASVGHVVRRACARAGVRRPRRGAAHLFRHSLATRMIRSGASMPEISEVLRHRSPGTTEIYAKVAFEALREVARPWPLTWGDQ